MSEREVQLLAEAMHWRSRWIQAANERDALRERVAALEAALASVDDDYTLEADR